jgi:hypothetical protein
MNQRFLFSLAALSVLVVCAFTLGLRAQPGSSAQDGPARTLNDIDPGTPLSPGYGCEGGGGVTDGFNHVIAINAPGYYYLTGNLDVPPGYEGVLINSGGVHVDLRGFSIRGTTGTGDGIRVASPLKANIIIRNGIVTLMAQHGIDAQFARNVLINTIAASANGGVGIMFSQGRARDCVSRGNTTDGFLAFQYSSFESCSADANGVRGFNTGGGNAFANCSATANSGVGFLATTATLTDCTALNNNGGGISLSVGTIRGCGLWGNSPFGISSSGGSVIAGCSESGSPIGISIGAGGHVSECACSSSSIGISITGAGAHIEHNTITGGTTGITSSAAGSFVFGNTISGPVTPISLTGTNFVGTTISSAGSIVSTTSPLCNFVQ